MIYVIELRGKDPWKRRRTEHRPDKNSAMALWKTWMRDKTKGDRISVRNTETGKYEVIEHG